MKILHICAGWEKWNGAANIARLIMSEQVRQGHAVSSCTWASIRQLRSADEVWIHCGWLPCLWWAALWGRDVRWVPEACYDPIRRVYHGWKKALAGPIERFCLRRCDKIVATCEAEAEWIRDYLGKRCPSVEVTDIKRFFNLSHVDHAEQVEGRPLHLLYLGRRHPLKGLEYLESAVAQLNAKWGNRSDLFPHLGTTGSIRLIDLKVVSNAFGEEKEQAWKWSDALVLPTLSENFGLVIAEALERGKRVITTDGAPAWGENLSRVEHVECVESGEILSGYEGRLIYLKGYRDGTPEERVWLLKNVIEELVCHQSK